MSVVEIIIRRCVIGCRLVFACCLIAVAPAMAGPGFIASSRVTVDDSDDAALANIEVRFNCKTQYLDHDPFGNGDRVRIFLEPTQICNGVSPVVAEDRIRFRPLNSEKAHLMEMEYDGDMSNGPALTLVFDRPVSFDVDMRGITFSVNIRIRDLPSPAEPVATTSLDATVTHRRVENSTQDPRTYVINLASYQRIPTVTDLRDVRPGEGQKIFFSEAQIDGTRWYRLRLGNFSDAADAKIALAEISSTFPGAWIDHLEADASVTEMVVATNDEPQAEPMERSAPSSKIDGLMEDARRAIIAGETSKAIQIYTKVLQQNDSSRHAEAQEYLAIAREKNGQLAHAKAEYERYLSLYPDNDGAARVNQRLAALIASDRVAGSPNETSGQRNPQQRTRRSDWRVQTFVSQYYRRDVNQLDDQDEIVSQSALYSDINFDARRRGERFDFSSRLSAGYRSNFLDETTTSRSGNATSVSYAYADLADAVTGLQGRIGRQSRNTGGVLGRFDGLNIGYQVNEKLLLETVLGKPAYSSSDGVDSSRTFYGLSANYGPPIEGLDLGLYYVQQDIENIRDRQALGGEVRYFGPNQSLWGMVEYDLHFGELANAFLQGSWRFDSRLSLHATASRRGSPFLSTGNAIIGQPVADFAELAEIFTANELTELGRDRTASSSNYTLGMSYSLAPNLQINADAGRSTIDATPESGGVFATPGSTYTYYSGNLLMSSLVKEGDVSIVGLRYSNSDTSQITSLSLDTRYPIGRSWRINARLRVDNRQITSNDGEQWQYTPSLRIQYRRSQRFRMDLETGKLFSQQESDILSQDRESYFINVGYQIFF